MPHSLTARRAKPLSGDINVPGDKSISHRALILGALATGRTVIDGLLASDDVMATARVLGQLGVPIRNNDGEWQVMGRGPGGLSLDHAQDDGSLGTTTPAERPVLDFGNSGTSARLMMGVLAAHDIKATLDGDSSLRKRPMGRVIEPLLEMGLQVGGNGPDNEEYRLPLVISGTASLVPIQYTLPVASAQVKSAVLLAGLHSAGRTSVIEPVPTRDHTERMIVHMGGEISVEDRNGGRLISIEGQQELTGRTITVPGDPSSAAFPIAAALIVPGSQIIVRNVLCNPLRSGLFETLREMGADIEYKNEIVSAGERVADISVSHCPLNGVTVPAGRAASMIDEYPVLAVIAARAKGQTVMRGLGELRVKESDRLATTLNGLRANGIEARIDGDDLIVEGSENIPGGGVVATELDHRIAMSFLVLGLGAEAAIAIDDARMISTSFPDFDKTMSRLGAEFDAGPAGRA